MINNFKLNNFKFYTTKKSYLISHENKNIEIPRHLKDDFQHSLILLKCFELSNLDIKENSDILNFSEYFKRLGLISEMEKPKKTVNYDIEKKTIYIFTERNKLYDLLDNYDSTKGEIYNYNNDIEKMVLKKNLKVIDFGINIEKLHNLKNLNIKNTLLSFYYNGNYIVTYLDPPRTHCIKCFIKKMRENLNLFNNLYSKKALEAEIPEYDFKKANKILQETIDKILNTPEKIIGKVTFYKPPAMALEEVVFIDLECNCGKEINYDAESLIGNSVGLIKGIGYIDVGDIYPAFIYTAAKTHKKSLGGSLDYKLERGKTRALYEAIERISWFMFKGSDNIVEDSWLNLPSEYKIPLESLKYYEKELYNKSNDGCLEKINKNTVLPWVLVKDYNEIKTKALPLQYFLSSNSKEIYKFPSSTGLAASDNSSRAKYNAIMEIIERDVVTRYWNSELSAIKLSTKNKKLFNSEIFQRLKSNSYDLEIRSIINQYGVFVIIAKIYNNRLENYYYGCSAGKDIFKVIEKSILEALLMKVYYEKNHKKAFNYYLPYLEMEINWDVFSFNEDVLNNNLSRFYLLDITPNLFKQNIYVYKAWGMDTIDFPSQNEKSISDQYLNFPFN